MKCFVTGGTGYIGSHLVDRLLADGHEVHVYDNLSTGKLANLQQNFNLSVMVADLNDITALKKEMAGSEIVFHLAANADVRNGPQHPSKDLQENTINTFNVLEAMRKNGVKKIVFASTGSVYGEAKVIPTPENCPMPEQTSLYSASKLACEGLIQAYCHAFDMQAWIYRFVSVLGPRYSHGHVIDFMNQLKKNPHELTVLGDGSQTKSYMHVSDCVNGVITGLKSNDRINIFNLGVDGTFTVRNSVATICSELGVSPEIHYGTERQGWIGDNPMILLDCRKIRSFGWKPRYSIKEALIDTVRYLK